VSHFAVGAAAGIVLSITASVAETPNPARIPACRLVFRSAFGVVLWLLSSSLLAWLISCLARRVGLPLPSAVRGTYWAGFLLGLVVPQLGALKDRLVPYAVARRVSKAFRMIQTYDEITRLYLKRIIAREERKINQEFFDPRLHPDDLRRRENALHQLFEFHQVEIALDRRQRLRERKPEKVLSVFYFRRRDLKFKLLLRFLGCHQALRALKSLARQPDLLPGQAEMHPLRTLKSPYVRAYVLGKEVGPY
jgi:hypothetical protein